MAILVKQVIIHFGISLLLCCSLPVSEASGQSDAENAEDLVESSTTEDLIDIICSCREQVTAEDYPRDCFDIIQTGQTKSGIYTIYPSVNVKTGNPIDVYCDMKTDDGGWTVFQKRKVGSVEFNRGWEDYKSGFGYVGSEFWLGNEHIFAITNQNDYEMRIDIQERDGTKHFITYDLFRLGDETSDFRSYLESSSNSPGNCQDVFQLGMKDGRIKDSQISASSRYESRHAAVNARLDRPARDGSFGAWCAKVNDANQWIQVDLDVSRLVAGVILQGRADYDQWLPKYKVQYAEGDATLQYVTDASGNELIFDGNTDRNTHVTSMFPSPVEAKSIRIQPTAWSGHICTRFELLGCQGDSLAANHNFEAFSTQDMDNDPDNGSNCAINTGPWWYGACDNSGLNGPYLVKALSEHGGILWKDFQGYSHYLKSTEMKIRPVMPVING
ncbi:uncharacterized protein [Amphiura filiformis]|uniref:uncharacterized protein isoform X2 n=1 Tax=Amphiura filiformis TaxID=82378 RepID=UPI003B218DB7